MKISIVNNQVYKAIKKALFTKTISSRSALLLCLLLAMLYSACSSDDITEPNVLNRNILLTTQSEVREFAKLGVTHLQGNLTIGNTPGEALNMTSILDLSDISSLAEIDGNLTIYGNNNIKSLDGLNNLLLIGGDLTIGINEKLEDLDGLSALETIGGKVSIILNRALTNLNGLDDVSGITALTVDDNQFITSLFDMSAVSEMGELRIESNRMISSLEGLRNTNVSSIYIDSNPNLETLKGLESTTAVQSITLSWNENLKSVEGLENLTSIEDILILERNDNLESLSDMGVTGNGPVRLMVERNPKLTILGSFKMRPLLTEEDYQVIIFMNPELNSVSPLSNLTSMNNLYLFDNDGLENLAGLSNLRRVNDLTIVANDGLTNLQGLEQLSVVDNLGISLNTELVSLDGLNGLTVVNQKLNLGANAKLSNLCALQTLIDGNGIMSELEITSNAFNPSLEDLQNGNCSN